MTHNMRALILAGVVGIGGLLGSGTTTARAHDYGYGPGFSPGIAVGEPYGPGYVRGYGRGYRNRGGYGYGGGYGFPGPRSYYYESRTTITIVYCDRCGRYHDRYAPCGGYGGGHSPW